VESRLWRQLPSALSWLVPLVLYAASARRDVWFWDTGEMDTVPWILGIAHPTGFPAYVVLGYAFSHVVAIGSVAFRMSLMSACAMAAAAYFVYRCVEEDGASRWIAMLSGWFFAFGSIVWTRGTRAEVHALAACAFAATIFYALRWYRSGARTDLYAAAAAFGVGLAVHPVLLLALPALVFVVLTRPAHLEAGVTLKAVALAVACAAVWYVYLPLRSLAVAARGLDPSRSLGLPAGGAFWDYDHPASAHGFVALAGGGDFDLGTVLHGIVAGSAHGAGFALYGHALTSEFLPIGVAAVAAGAYVAWIRDRARAAALFLFAVPCVVFGAGFPPESDPSRYFIPSFIVAAVLVGGAAGFLARQLPPMRGIVTAALGALVVALVVTNRWIFAQAGDESARAVIVDVQQRTPANAILVANWLDGPPLAYAAYVERSLQARTLTIAWVGDLGPRMRSWLRTRPVYVVGPSNPGGLPGYHLDALAGSPIFRVTP
jgi:hypothetical protein